LAILLQPDYTKYSKRCNIAINSAR